MDGLLIGLGGEYAFAPHRSAKFEYNYWNFGAQNVTIADTTADVVSQFNTSASANAHVVKAGFNYRFQHWSIRDLRYQPRQHRVGDGSFASMLAGTLQQLRA